jgi:peptidoglycan/LPS O-acetylase OafA/YrhL
VKRAFPAAKRASAHKIYRARVKKAPAPWQPRAKTCPPSRRCAASRRWPLSSVISAARKAGPRTPSSSPSSGYLAVDLFFVLSGFVLAHVHGGAAASGLSIRFVGRFLWARFARLYPTYAAVTLLVAAMSVAAGGPSAGALATNLAMAQVPWTSAPSLVFVAWSVSAEWNAYLLFPVAAPLLLRCGARLGFALYAAMGIAILAAASLQWFGPWGGVITGWGALARAVPQFLMGMLLYRAYRAGFLRGLWASDLMLAAIAAGIAAVVALGLGDGVAAMLFPPLILAAVSNRGAGGRMLNARPLRWLGDISYSLYLTQVFVFAAIWRVAPTPVAKLLGPWEAALAGTLLALAVGALFHRTVEEPARILLRALPETLAARWREARARA